jgi:hypothetical protein
MLSSTYVSQNGLCRQAVRGLPHGSGLGCEALARRGAATFDQIARSIATDLHRACLGQIA